MSEKKAFDPRNEIKQSANGSSINIYALSPEITVISINNTNFIRLSCSCTRACQMVLFSFPLINSFGQTVIRLPLFFGTLYSANKPNE